MIKDIKMLSEKTLNEILCVNRMNTPAAQGRQNRCVLDGVLILNID